MKKSSLSVLSAVLLTLILLQGAQTAAFADATKPVDRDVTFSAAGGDNDPSSNINIVRMTSTQGVSGGCAPLYGGAFSVDVSDLSGSVPADAVSLSVAVANLGTGNNYPLTLELFTATADISESPVTTTPLATLRGPSLGSQVTVPAAPAIGSTITFPSSTNLVLAFNTAAGPGGDGRLTVLAQITACPGTGNYTIDIASHESGTPGILSITKTNAVALRSLNSAAPAANWPLIAGLALLALLLGAGGFLALRRRSA